MKENLTLILLILTLETALVLMYVYDNYEAFPIWALVCLFIYFKRKQRA